MSDFDADGFLFSTEEITFTRGGKWGRRGMYAAEGWLPIDKTVLTTVMADWLVDCFIDIDAGRRDMFPSMQRRS